MANKMRLRTLAVALAAAVFATSVIAFIIFTNESLTEDGSKAMMYAAIIIVVFVLLNAILLLIAYRAMGKTKREQTKKKCVSCGAAIDIYAKACVKCSALQPEILDENTYLDPKETGSNEISPKR